MAHKLLLVLCACAALAAGADLRARRDASPLEDVQKQLADLQGTISKNLKDLVESDSTKNLQNSLKESSDQLLAKLSGLGASWGELAKEASGKAKEVLEQSRAAVEKNVAELRSAHPEVEQQAHALSENIKTGIANAVQESQKVAAELQKSADAAGKELQPKLKAVSDNLLKNLQDVHAQLLAAAPKQ